MEEWLSVGVVLGEDKTIFFKILGVSDFSCGVATNFTILFFIKTIIFLMVLPPDPTGDPPRSLIVHNALPLRVFIHYLIYLLSTNAIERLHIFLQENHKKRQRKSLQQ